MILIEQKSFVQSLRHQRCNTTETSCLTSLGDYPPTALGKEIDSTAAVSVEADLFPRPTDSAQHVQRVRTPEILNQLL